MSNFKKGDYVLVKNGTTIDDFGLANDWGGKITEVDGSGTSISIQLDASTLQQLPDSYIEKAMDNGEDIFEYCFLDTDLTLDKRRDTDAEYKTIHDNIYDRMGEMDDDYLDDDAMMAKLKGWSSAFAESYLVKELSQADQEDANFVADTFVNYAWRYVAEIPDHWNADTVRTVCLNYIVGKVSAPAEELENYGRILALFFRYLYEEGHIPDSTELQKTALEIAAEIPKRAADPQNWHMAKSMMMGGVEQGLDLSDSNAIDAYLRMQQQQALGRLQEVQEPIRNTKKIGRNDKVSVKYNDGKVVKNVKYKKVMRDVENGKCSVL